MLRRKRCLVLDAADEPTLDLSGTEVTSTPPADALSDNIQAIVAHELAKLALPVSGVGPDVAFFQISKMINRLARDMGLPPLEIDLSPPPPPSDVPAIGEPFGEVTPMEPVPPKLWAYQTKLLSYPK